MRFFNKVVPALVAAVFLGVTGILAQSEDQVFDGILSLVDTSTEVQYALSGITEDNFPSTGTVCRYTAAALCGPSSHSH